MTSSYTFDSRRPSAAVFALAGAMWLEIGGCAVQALQPQQVAAVVDDGDRHGPVVLQGFGFGGSRDLF